MKNLCALMEYLIWNIIFQNALLSLVWTFSFTLFYLTLTLPPLQPEIRPFNSCIAHKYVSNGDKIEKQAYGRTYEKQAYGRTYSLIEFERLKHINPKHMSVGVYINERTYHFGMT